MSVKNEHQDFIEMKPEWIKCTDFATSEKAVHDMGTIYLPMLTDQEEEEYISYKAKAPVMMFGQRSGLAMTGMATRKEPLVEGADLIEDLLNSIDADDNDFNTYLYRVCLRFLYTGRAGTLIDVPRVNGTITQLQAEQQGVRPRFLYYKEEAIINWRKERINNINTTVLVVLRELVDDVEDEFTFKPEFQYRVLDLIDGKYRQRIFDVDGNEIPDSEVFPRMNGQFMDFIPFVFHGGAKPIQPPLNGIFDINLHHYQLGADETYGLGMAALPTPYLFGVDPDDDNFPGYVGPGRVIGASDPDCKTGFREYSGAGLESVANKLQKFEDIIASMAVQMTQDTLAGSATGSAIDYSNSTASLSGVVQILNQEFNEALKIAAEWSGVDPDKVELTMNKDFMPAGMDAPMLAALLQAYLSGTISYATYYNALAKGEVTDPHKNPEDEMDAIEKAPPPGAVGSQSGPRDGTGPASNDPDYKDESDV